MKFYTNAQLIGDYVYLRGYEDGERVKLTIPCTPYLFVTSPRASKDYRTLDNQNVAKVEFSSPKDARQYIEDYQDVAGHDVYGLEKFLYTFLNDHYQNEIRYDPSLISVVTLDIETDSEGGFPNIETADREVIAITIRKNDNSLVFGMKPYTPESNNIVYIQCENERVLLEKFIRAWRSDEFLPDVITGWNVEFFDMPYLINRIRRILGDSYVRKLSPFEKLTTRKFELAGREIVHETPVGVNILDYLGLYRKFSFSQQESFKLDHIAFIELGERKLDYHELGFETLDEFYKGDFRNFINYNIRDVDLVYRLDEKLKFLEQVYALAYDAKVNYIDTLTTVGMWDVIIHNYLLQQGIVVPQSKKNKKDRQIEGAYVKDPQVGLHRWVCSFDLNSLYPHLMMQYNISPDTLFDQIDQFKNIERYNDQGMLVDFQITDSVSQFIDNGVLDNDNLRNYLVENNLTITPTGCTFVKDFQGFLPKLMETMYNDRSAWKKKMLEAKKQYEQTPTKELANEIARCHNMQLAKKIQLNSAYGALSNAYFRWFDPRLAESITKSGQLSIRWMEKHINQYLNKLFKTEGEDYVIACDTDSMYIRMEKLVDTVMADQPIDKVVAFVDKVCDQKIEPFIDKCYDELGQYVNAYAQKMKMKREAIADKGIWTGKKHYILNVWNLEGVAYKEPKLKMMGIEAVRSSTPSSCRDNIKKALSIIMNKTEDELIDFIAHAHEQFRQLPFDQVAFPRSVKDMNKYYDREIGYRKIGAGGVPIHVRGALVYNHRVRKQKLDTILPLIVEGDKIKYSYMLMPNPFHENVLAAPGALPKQLGMDKYIDYDTQFDKGFVEPIKTILDVIGWKTERRSTLESFFG